MPRAALVVGVEVGVPWLGLKLGVGLTSLSCFWRAWIYNHPEEDRIWVICGRYYVSFNRIIFDLLQDGCIP